MRRFELVEGKSSKFWEVSVDGASLTVRFGRIGTTGQTQAKDLGSAAKALAEQDKLVREKTKKGYVEVGGGEERPATGTGAGAGAGSGAGSGAGTGTGTGTGAEAVEVPSTTTTTSTKRPDRPVRSVPFDTDAAFTAIQAWHAGEKKEKNKYLRADEPGFIERLHRAHDAYANGNESMSLDLDMEAAYGTLFYEYEMLYGWWRVRGGPAFLVRAWAETWRYDAWGHAHPNLGDPHYKYAKSVWPVQARPLRAAIASLDSERYEKARAEAEKIRGVAALPLRIAIAFLLPDEPHWALEDAAALAAHREKGTADVLTWRGSDLASPLLGALAVPTLALREINVLGAGAERWAEEMADALGQAATGPLEALIGKLDGDRKAEVVGLLARIDTADAASALAKLADDKHARASVKAFATRRPDLAVPALARVIASRGRAADAAKQLLVGLASSASSAFEQASASLSGKERAAIDEIRARLAPVDEASASDVPALLAQPPWARGQKPAAAPHVPGLEPLAVKERVEWEKGARNRWGQPLPSLDPAIDLRSLVSWKELPGGVAPRTAKMDEAVQKKIGDATGGGYFHKLHFVESFLHQMTDAAALKAWNETSPVRLDSDSPTLEYAFARFGPDALPGAIAAAERNPAPLLPPLARVATTRSAPLMAEAFHRMKKASGAARTWMLRFPEEAVTGLIPVALSHEDAKIRTAGCAALRFLAVNDHAATIRSVAKLYGIEAERAADLIVGSDPGDLFPAKLPKLPGWLDIATLPRPILRGKKKALPADAVQHLVTMLSFSTLDEPYAGLDAAKEACDPESLAELVWSLFQQWLLAGGTGKDDWALLALGHFGDDETARRLAPLIRVWPGEAAHARAVKGLDVLGAIGSDVALMHLDGIANKVKFKGLQEKARERIEQIAADRDLTREELADRLVPDLDLEPDGSRELSFGPRKFFVGFDEHLEPYVMDDAKKRLKELPKPGKSDDAEVAAEAVKTWKALKKDAKTVGQLQVDRLERAMCSLRAWDFATFRTFFVEHPLMIHVVRRLVMAVVADGKPTTTFRVAEDRSFAGIDDDVVDLPKDATIGIVHPLVLDERALVRWGEVLADYELLPPFPQLTRETFRPTDAEKKATAVTRLDGVEVPTGKVLGLASRGWEKGFAQDAGWIWHYTKPLPGGLEAVLSLGGGILAGSLADSPKEQKLGAVSLSRPGERSDTGTVTVGALDQVVFSELVRDLEQLRA